MSASALIEVLNTMMNANELEEKVKVLKESENGI